MPNTVTRVKRKTKTKEKPESKIVAYVDSIGELTRDINSLQRELEQATEDIDFAMLELQKEKQLVLEDNQETLDAITRAETEISDSLSDLNDLLEAEHQKDNTQYRATEETILRGAEYTLKLSKRKLKNVVTDNTKLIQEIMDAWDKSQGQEPTTFYKAASVGVTPLKQFESKDFYDDLVQKTYPTPRTIKEIKKI